MTRTLTSDAAGNVLTSTDARSVTTVNASPSSRVFTVGYGYTSGRQSSITYPSGRLVAYGFDAQGRITSIAVDGTAVLGSVDYTAFGPPSKWTWANSQVMERTFDGDGLLKSYTSGPSSGTYSDLEQVFGYDAVNRLVSATLAAGQTQAFAYDAVGNRTSATLNSATTTYTYPGTNHKLSGLSGATTRSFAYDGAGNVTSTLGLTYVYDGRGRLKQAGATTYLVNGLGQRVKKGGGSEIFFAYDEQGHLIGEYDSTGAAIEETLWLGDTPVATLKPNGAGGFTVYYIWTDHLNTPRLITDAANNKRWEWAHNDPFGNNAANENPSGLGQFTYNLRFPGQYYDAETGNHYNYFRDYDPRIGRYIQSDPVGLIGGPSTFSYSNGSPARYADPLGLWSTEVHELMLNTLFPTMDRADMFNVEAGSSFVDRTANQFAVDSSYQHAMTDPGQSVAEARRKACEFILSNLSFYESFKNSRVGRYRTMAYRALGMALHPVMDSTSPSHEGWQPWLPTKRPLDSYTSHGNHSPEDLRHLTAGRLNEALTKMRRILSRDDCACVMR